MLTRRVDFAAAVQTADPGDEVVGIGLDLGPDILLQAYSAGCFPMGLGPGGGAPLGWWSPDPRGVLLPGNLRVTRSLRQSMRRFTVTWDTAFAEVVGGCADPARDSGWITAEVAAAYQQLHVLGLAHSVEVWSGTRLAGGLYGVAVGGLFAGESMFHRERDASKVALTALVDLVGLDRGECALIDAQWCTPHLRSLGFTEVSRADYVRRLEAAVTMPAPRWRGSALRNQAEGGGAFDRSS